MTMVHDAVTGTLRMLIADGGLLTELRTAATAAVAADLLARPGARSAAVIGTGGQARYQLLALLQVRPIEQVTVRGHRRPAPEQYQRDMATAGVPVCIAATRTRGGPEVVITATSSTGPLIEDGWLAHGAHVTAVGSDMPHKQGWTRGSSWRRSSTRRTASTPPRTRASCATRCRPAGCATGRLVT